MNIEELKLRLQQLLYQRRSLGYEAGNTDLEDLRWAIDGEIQKLRSEIRLMVCLSGGDPTGTDIG